MPVGYEAGVAAYQRAVQDLTVDDLTHHYTDGLRHFHNRFVPYLKDVLSELTGGIWNLSDYHAYAAGSDVDFMTHLVGAVASDAPVSLYPGDWYGFRVGLAKTGNVVWNAEGDGALACLCVPSVRNGHVTEDMIRFLSRAEACLLNINLFPTLSPLERQQVARTLLPVLEKSVLSISFSRGFGLTGSQLGVALIHRDHPLRQLYETQWTWLTYFHNGIAMRAFMALDLDEIARVDQARRKWVSDWLRRNELPQVDTGSYYVRSFRLSEPVPTALQSLHRSQVLRLCLKPTSR